MKTMIARYSMPDNIPDYIKNLPEGAQRIFVEVYNAELADSGDEDKARMAGWGAVKNKYEKQDDEWVRKATEPGTLRYVSMLGELSPGDGNKGTKTTVVQVFRTGTFRHPLYGKFTITDEHLKTMVTNFKASRPKSPTEMVVDYEHMSAVGQPSVAPAAGWVKGLDFLDGKLFATVEWTEKASGLIRAKEYRFVSPEWHMNYKDKETGKDLGPCLLSMALTNRPFIEGMQPVMLSDRLEEANAAVLMLSEKTLRQLLSEESMDEKSSAVRQAFYAQFPEADTMRTEYVSEIYEDYVIVEKAGELFKVAYSKDAETGKITFDEARVKVTRSKEFLPVAEGQEEVMTMAEWTTEYINDMPDSSFAYIAPGGEKDEGDKTVPRTLRYLPYKDADGKVDLPHLRNALARLDQTDLSPEAKAKAKAVLDKAAESAGVGEAGEDEPEKGKETEPMEQELRQLLNLPPDGDIIEAVKALIEKAKTTDEAVQARDTAQASLLAIDVQKDIDQALNDHKLLPKQAGWAKALRAKDPEGFKAFLATAPEVGPEGRILGSETETEVTLTASEIEAGRKLGVSPEAAMAQKKEDAKKAKA